MKKKILFICNGNIHRSVIAAESLRQALKKAGLSREYSVGSYGLQGTMGTKKPRHTKLEQYPKEWKATAPILWEFNISISNHSYRPVTHSAIKNAAAIIAMDKKVLSQLPNSLMKQFPTLKHKMHSFSVLTPKRISLPDPHGNGNKDLHYKIISTINKAVHKNLNKILDWANK